MNPIWATHRILCEAQRQAREEADAEEYSRQLLAQARARGARRDAWVLAAALVFLTACIVGVSWMDRVHEANFKEQVKAIQLQERKALQSIGAPSR
jgi:hypothetical protein